MYSNTSHVAPFLVNAGLDLVAASPIVVILNLGTKLGASRFKTDSQVFILPVTYWTFQCFGQTLLASGCIKALTRGAHISAASGHPSRRIAVQAAILVSNKTHQLLLGRTLPTGHATTLSLFFSLWYGRLGCSVTWHERYSALSCANEAASLPVSARALPKSASACSPRSFSN